MVFLVEDGGERRVNYMSASIPREDREPALAALADAEHEMGRCPEVVPGGFADAITSLEESLPAVNWWQ